MNLKIPELILYTTKSPSRYTESQPEVLKVVVNGSGAESKHVIDNIKKIIKDKRISPSQKVLALDLFHSCMLLKRVDFVKISESRMIRLFTRLAQKPSIALFQDSSDCYENRNSSERFLGNLLKYLYIWANDSEIVTDKKNNEFKKAFYKLRDVVNFTPVKIVADKNRLIAQEKNEDKGYLNEILNTLDILEDIKNPENDELGMELISKLKESVLGLKKTLQLAVNQGRKEVEEKIKKLMNRIKKFVDVDSVNVLPVKNQMLLKSPNAHENPNILSGASSPIFTDIESCDLRLENSNLKKIIQEQEEVIKSMSQTINTLQSQVKLLEDNFNKTKELLYSKEQECAECHVVKESLRNSFITQPNNYNELISFAQQNFYSNRISLPQFTNTMSCPPLLEVPENDFQPEIENFRLCCCGKHDLLLENNFVRVCFEGQCNGDAFEFKLKIQNISSVRLSNLETDFDKAFGFNFIQKETKLVKLGPGEMVVHEFSITQICVTHLVPTVSLKFDLSDRFLEYIFQVPVNIAVFSKPIYDEPEQLWSEFELLAFDSETKTCKCEFSIRRCRKMIKLSPNCKILHSKKLNTLANTQFLGIFSLSSLCFVLITLNTLSKLAHIEIRSDSQSLRKTLFTLIITQITT